MAERLAYLEAVVGADITQFRKGMRDVRNETGLLSETIGGLGRIGRTLTFAYTAPLLALGSFAVQTAGQFEASMRNINAIAQLPIDQLDALSQRTLEFGRETRAGATASSEALYTVFSAGLTDVETAFNAMEVSVRTAEAGLADTTTTTEALVASMLAYGDTSEGFMNRTSDAMTQMVAIGVGSMQEFATGIGNVIPTASSLNMTIEELYGDLAFLTQRGLSASRASTSLNAALTSLAKPTEAMQQAFRRLGASGAEDLIEQFGGVNGALQALIGTTDGTQEEIQALFNNIRGARAINLFAQDIDAWNASMAEFNASVEGATMRAWEQQTASFMATWDRMTSALEGAAIVIGQNLFPIVTPLIQMFTNFLNKVSDLNPQLLTAATAFTALSVIIPPLIWAFTSLLSPVGLITAGLITLVGTISNSVPAFVNDLVNATETGSEALEGFLATVEAITGLDVSPSFERITSPLENLETVTVDAFDLITVETPRSLWDIYENEGYTEMFSWDEFMQAATDGGWEGGAITPDNPIRLNIGVEEVEAFDPRLVSPIMDDIEAEIATTDNPLENLLARFRMYMPTFVTQFNELWNSILTVAVPMVTNFINGLTNTMADIDLSNVIPALRQAFSGDILGAIETLLPETGGKLSGLLSSLFATNVDMSELQEAIRGLGSQISDFFFNDVVPIVAEGIGYMVGRIGFITRQGLAHLGDMLMGTGEAADYFGENIATPFNEGFQAAMEDVGQEDQSMLDTMLTGMLGFVTIGMVLNSGAVLGFASTIVGGIGKAVITRVGVSSIWSGVGTAVMGRIGSALSFVGRGLGISAVGNSIGSTIVAGIAAFPLSAAISALGLGTIIGVAVYNSSIIPQSLKDLIHNQFWNALESIFGTSPEDFQSGMEMAVRSWMGISEGLERGDWDWGDVASEFSQAITNIDDDEFAIDMRDDPFDVNMGITPVLDETTFHENLNQEIMGAVDSYEPPADVFAGMPTLDDMLGEFIGGGGGATKDSQRTNVQGKATTGGGEDTGVGSALLGEFVNQWVSIFGEEGTATVAWSTFEGIVVGGLTNIQDETTSLTEDTLPLIISWGSIFGKVLDDLFLQLEDVNRMLTAIKHNINTLAKEGVEPMTVNLSSGVDGKHRTGLANVPHDNYVAQLHKGERVLTAEENRNYVKGATEKPTIKSGDVYSSNNQFILSGITNVDEFIKELKLRNIHIDGG